MKTKTPWLIDRKLQQRCCSCECWRWVRNKNNLIYIDTHTRAWTQAHAFTHSHSRRHHPVRIDTFSFFIWNWNWNGKVCASERARACVYVCAYGIPPICLSSAFITIQWILKFKEFHQDVCKHVCALHTTPHWFSVAPRPFRFVSFLFFLYFSLCFSLVASVMFLVLLRLFLLYIFSVSPSFDSIVYLILLLLSLEKNRVSETHTRMRRNTQCSRPRLCGVL